MGSLIEATPRGIFSLTRPTTGTRGLAHSSHPTRRFSFTRPTTGTRGLARSSHPSRHSLTYATYRPELRILQHSKRQSIQTYTESSYIRFTRQKASPIFTSYQQQIR